MVRQKTRYLLIRLEFSGSVLAGTSSYIQDDCNEEFPTRKEVAWATQDSIKNCFGTAASDAASEIQGEFVLVSFRFLLCLVGLIGYRVGSWSFGDPGNIDSIQHLLISLRFLHCTLRAP